MRVFVLLLILCNLAYFAWTQFFAQQGSSERHLVEQQINRDAIRLLGPAQVAALTVSRKEAVKEPEKEPAKEPARDAGKVQACLEWGALNAADVAKAEEALATLSLDKRPVQRRLDDTARFWVYMPPQPTRAGAQQKAGELRRLGVLEFFIIQDEPKDRFTISLGVFRSEEAAKKRLEELRSQGVRTAQVGPRDTAVQRVYFQMQNVSEAQSAKLEAIRQGFAGSEVKECGAPTPAAAPAPAAAATPAAKAAPAAKVAR
jgi:hypothetical protein